MNTPTNGKRDVYVAGLPEGTDDAKIKEIFTPYGEVTWCRSLPREGSKTCGLVEFGTAEQAAWVVQNMQGSVPAGLEEPIMVKYKDDPWERKGRGKGGFFPDGFDGGWASECFYEEAGKGGGGLAGAGITVPPVAAIAAAAAAAASGKGGMAKGGVKGNLLPPEMQPPPPEPVPSDNIYLRNLPPDFTEEQLKELFGSFGTITQTKVMPGSGKTSALVRFSTVAEATALLVSLKTGIPPGLSEMVEAKFAENQQNKNQRYAGDGTPFGIDTIVKGFQMSGLMPGGTGYSNNSENALYIAGLPPDTTDYYLYRLFSPLGAIAPKGVRTLTNEDGTCKGIAFVNYLDHTSAQLAISLYNGTILQDGSRLKVAIKAPKVHTVPTPVVVPAPTRGVLPEGFSAPSVAPPVPAAVMPATLPMTVPPPLGTGACAEASDIVNPGVAAVAAAVAAAAAAESAAAKASGAAEMAPAGGAAAEAA